MSSLAVGVPAGWMDDGKILCAPAPQAAQITLGFRDLVLKRPGGWWPELQAVGKAYENGRRNTR